MNILDTARESGTASTSIETRYVRNRQALQELIKNSGNLRPIMVQIDANLCAVIDLRLLAEELLRCDRDAEDWQIRYQRLAAQASVWGFAVPI